MVMIETLLHESFGVAISDIEKAKIFQKNNSGSLEEILANMGALDESELPHFYSQLLELDISDSHIDLDNINVKKALSSPFSNELLKLNWFSLEEQNYATSSPLSIKAHEIIAQLDFVPEVKLVSREFSEQLKALYGAEIDQEEHKTTLSNSEEEKLRELASEAPVVNLFNSLINKALKMGASDMHIEPNQKQLKVRFRIDGILQSEDTVPKSLELALLTRLKILSGMDIAEKRRPQDGKIEFRISKEELDIRVSCLPLNDGESVVMRFLRKGAINLKMSALGIEPDTAEHINRDLAKTAGVILLTGPTGSGKTTSLYSFLNQLNNEKVKIITLEDPVEYQLDGVNQVQVNNEIGYDFASGLRSIVRQDPDVIMVGEIRDNETAKIALQSALTGHLVFSTLHTNDAASAYTRLIDLGVEPFLLDAALVSILAQRLVRTYCSCSEKMEPIESEEIVQHYKLNGLIYRYELANNIHKAVGCEKCNFTGYKGRMALIEYLKCDEELSLLGQDDFLVKARKLNRDRGYRNLLEDGFVKVLKGHTSIEEVLRVAG